MRSGMFVLFIICRLRLSSNSVQDEYLSDPPTRILSTDRFPLFYYDLGQRAEESIVEDGLMLNDLFARASTRHDCS
jgi:hypothetical protein